MNAAPLLPELRIDRSSPMALHKQLRQALRAAMVEGRLQPGTALPPSRVVAQQLQIGRNTVVEAYAALQADGLVETRGRHGSFISSYAQRLLAVQSQRVQARPASPLASSSARLIARLASTSPAQSPTSHPAPQAANPARPASHDWRLGLSGAQLLPLAVWRAACKAAGRQLPPSGYGDARGQWALRQAIAQWLLRERQLRYHADQIVVTQGSGAALDVLSAVLLQPGDVAVVEQVGYTRAPLAFARAGATVRAVPVDAQGLCVEAVFAAAAQAPQIIHLTPSHQYPLGVRLSSARRLLFMESVPRLGCFLIENEYDHEFIHEGQNLAPLAAGLPEHTAVVSTFAKALSPSLRLGFIAAPLPLADALAAHIEATRSQVSATVQSTVHWLMQSGEMQKHLRRVRRHMVQLRQLLLQQLRLVAKGFTVSGQNGGQHVLLRAQQHTRMQRLQHHLTQQGVVFQTLRDFGGDEEVLLLGYGHMTMAEVAKCIETLESALHLL